jgi:WS/DGAT/MGAT family acyltransferase
VPLRLGRPVWVDDPHLDLGYHVRRAGLPRPGGDQQLAELMAQVMSQRLDRDHPLWEYWVIEGLVGDRWALISKVHHCMVDGVSGTDLYRVIFDVSPEPSPPAAADDRAVRGEPSSLELAAQAALGDLVLPVRGALALTGAAADPGGALRRAGGTVGGLAKLAPALGPATGSSLSGPIGRQRRFTWARASLKDVKTIRREMGGTVNDVVLAVISGGFRGLLLARGEEPGPHMVRSLVPVSVRAAGEENIYDNRVTAVLADLPVHLAGPEERLAAVRAGLAALKTSGKRSSGRRRPACWGTARTRWPPGGSGWRSGCRRAMWSPHHERARSRPAVVRDGPPPAGDHPLRADRRRGPHRDRDLQLLRRPHLRHHRRLRDQPRP